MSEWAVGLYAGEDRAFIGELGGSICWVDGLTPSQADVIVAKHNESQERVTIAAGDAACDHYELAHYRRFKSYLEIMGGIDVDFAWDATEAMDWVWKPAAVEPWDGLFVGSLSMWKLRPDGSARTIDEVVYPGLGLEEVGLGDGSLLDVACRGYAAEWDGLFVGRYFVSQLHDNGSITMVEQVHAEFDFPGWSLAEALMGYAAE